MQLGELAMWRFDGNDRRRTYLQRPPLFCAKNKYQLKLLEEFNMNYAKTSEWLTQRCIVLKESFADTLSDLAKTYKKKQNNKY